MTVGTTTSGVTTPQGFRAAGVSAGIKRDGLLLDLALVVSDLPATAAAVFTTNRAQAAPVIVSREHLARSDGVARAIIVNSGCATAASVVTNPSIVAIIGSIMPEPLAMPPMPIVRPPIVIRPAASFGKGSVVMMARAAAPP